MTVARASLKKGTAGIEQNLNGMLTRANTVASYLDRVVWPKFQKAQIKRWETENASQGAKWKPIDPKSPYGKLKPKKFAAYPGAGRALMVATGRLSKAAMGRDGYNKIVTNKGMTVAVDLGAVPYAGYAGELRPYMTFSDATLDNWKSGIMAYVAKGRRSA